MYKSNNKNHYSLNRPCSQSSTQRVKDDADVLVMHRNTFPNGMSSSDEGGAGSFRASRAVLVVLWLLRARCVCFLCRSYLAFVRRADLLRLSPAEYGSAAIPFASDMTSSPLARSSLSSSVILSRKRRRNSLEPSCDRAAVNTRGSMKACVLAFKLF